MSEADWQAFDRQWCAAMAPVRENIASADSLLGLARLVMADRKRFELDPAQSAMLSAEVALRTERAALCQRAAHRTWDVGPESVLQAQVALRMVRDLGPSRDPAWTARATAVEAAMQWLSDQSDISMKELPGRVACLPAPATRGAMVDRVMAGEWPEFQAQFAQQPEALAALAARYRAGKGGLSLLDARPKPTTRP